MQTMSPFFKAEKEGESYLRPIRDKKANWATAMASTPMILPVMIAARNNSRKRTEVAIAMYSII